MPGAVTTGSTAVAGDDGDEGDDDLWAALEDLGVEIDIDDDGKVGTKALQLGARGGKRTSGGQQPTAQDAARQLGSAPPKKKTKPPPARRKMPTINPAVDKKTGATKYAYGTMPAGIELDTMDEETARATFGALVGSSAAPWRHGKLKFSEAVQKLQGQGVGAFVLSDVKPREHCLTVIRDHTGRCAHFKVETREQMSNIPVFLINGKNIGEYRTVEDLVGDLLEDTRGILPVQLVFDTALPPSPHSSFVSAGSGAEAGAAWSVELDEIEF